MRLPKRVHTKVKSSGSGLVWMWALLVSGACMARGAWPRTRGTSPRPSSITTVMRVQNGQDDLTNKYPFVLAVLKSSKARLCSSILLAPTWVLSAAHCKGGTYVQYGNMTLSRDEITSISEILQMIPHPNYKAYKYEALSKNMIYNDIALMLIQEVRLDKFARLSALDYNSLRGFHVEFAGFGFLDKKYSHDDHRKPLQIGGGMVSSCKDAQTKLFYYPKICIAPQCTLRQAMLPGDSGGPLFIDGKVVGINVAIIKTPNISICTPVSPYIAWIQNIITV